MSSKMSSKTSVATSKVTTQKKNYYDEWRPPPGIRYQLSQTNVHFDAVVPNLKLEYTTVDYEPGQDLTVPETVIEEKYAKPRGRGPVYIFQEEVDNAKIAQLQKIIIKTVLKSYKTRSRQLQLEIEQVHNELMYAIGPVWFHELSPKQMRSADALKDAMLKDFKRDTIINTQETLGHMGLVLWPNHTKVEYALKKFYLCPVEFLLTIFRLNRPKDPEKENEYTLNDRIILSCVVHLTMRDTLRELHLRIPSPPPSTEPIEKPKPKVNKHKKPVRNKWKRVKYSKGMSPYLQPLIPVEQPHTEEVYKNRHKEYASLQYFDYVEDMYNIFYEDDPEEVRKRKQLKKLKRTRWNKPPKIPVRFIESKMKKKRVCQLKTPSPYFSPCKKLRSMTVPEPEPEPVVINTNIDLDNICSCSPQNFNEDTAFDLKIKITTSDEEYLLTQKLCPYSSKNAIGELNLIEQNKVEKDEEEEVCCEETEDERKPFKKIEYTCECCTCRKSINIFPEENSNIGVKDLNKLNQIINSKSGLDTIIEEDGEMYDEYQIEPEESESLICKCQSRTETVSTEIDDPYYNCTCRSSSDSCTCCICDQMDKDFLLKIKRYNEAFNTKHQPCLCACKCKKYKKPTCCNAVEEPCKYCFCRKKKPIMEEEQAEEHTPEEQEAEERKIRISDDIESINEPKICECEKLYSKYLDAHASCMSLFANYKIKIEEDVKEYLKDMKENRCLCGDSISDLEGQYDEEEKKFLEELKGEESSDSECICQKGKRGVCCCCSDPDDPFSGCTCNQTGVALVGCTCNNTDSSDTTTTSSENNKVCSCACTCGEGPCQCEQFLLKVKEEKARLTAEREALPNTSKKSLLKEDLDEDLSEEQTIEQPDPRIIILDKFPTDHEEQQLLLKMALAALAEDGYPLAQLPDVHRLPHFQVWLDFRSRAYISMEARGNLYQTSKGSWNHVDICERKVDIPQAPLSKEQIHYCTWGGVNKFKKMISVLRTDYNRRLKQAYISQAQELFPSMCHYQLPNKTFRDVYFSYLAPDENHIFVFKPWQVHEKKNMTSHQPC